MVKKEHFEAILIDALKKINQIPADGILTLTKLKIAKDIAGKALEDFEQLDKRTELV